MRLEDGRAIEAKRAVVSALEPKQTFLKFVGESKLAPEFAQMVKRYSFRKASASAACISR